MLTWHAAVGVLSCGEQLSVLGKEGPPWEARPDDDVLDERLVEAVRQHGDRHVFGQWPVHQVDGAFQALRDRIPGWPLFLNALHLLAEQTFAWFRGQPALRPEGLLRWREELASRIDLDTLRLAFLVLRPDATAPPAQNAPHRNGDAHPPAPPTHGEIRSILQGLHALPDLPPIADTRLATLRQRRLPEPHRHASLGRLPGQGDRVLIVLDRDRNL